jgi:hypothetical protein
LIKALTQQLDGKKIRPVAVESWTATKNVYNGFILSLPSPNETCTQVCVHTYSGAVYGGGAVVVGFVKKTPQAIGHLLPFGRNGAIFKPCFSHHPLLSNHRLIRTQTTWRKNFKILMLVILFAPSQRPSEVGVRKRRENGLDSIKIETWNRSRFDYNRETKVFFFFFVFRCLCWEEQPYRSALDLISPQSDWGYDVACWAAISPPSS